MIILKKSLQNRAPKEINPCLSNRIQSPNIQEDFPLYGNELLEQRLSPFLENTVPLQDKIFQITQLIFPPKAAHHVHMEYPCSFVYVILCFNIFGGKKSSEYLLKGVISFFYTLYICKTKQYLLKLEQKIPSSRLNFSFVLKLWVHLCKLSLKFLLKTKISEAILKKLDLLISNLFFPFPSSQQQKYLLFCFNIYGE